MTEEITALIHLWNSIYSAYRLGEHYPEVENLTQYQKVQVLSRYLPEEMRKPFIDAYNTVINTNSDEPTDETAEETAPEWSNITWNRH